MLVKDENFYIFSHLTLRKENCIIVYSVEEEPDKYFVRFDFLFEPGRCILEQSLEHVPDDFEVLIPSPAAEGKP